MAKTQLIALYAIAACFITGIIIEKNYITTTGFLVIAAVILLLFCIYIVLSVKNIFYSRKLLKAQDKERLLKLACIVKIGAILFWIAVLYISSQIYLWGSDVILTLIFIYILLLGTSVFSIAYIKLLYNEKSISARSAVILVLLQIFFVLDIVSFLILRSSGKINKQSIAKFTSFFLGLYKPPGFITAIASSVKQSKIPATAAAFIANQWKSHRIRSIAVIAVLCLIPAGLLVFNFYKLSKPQPIPVDFFVSPPDTTGDPSMRRPLSVHFHGSAAAVEMKDREIPQGMISINPPMEGSWQWDGDSVLIFHTEQSWQTGRRYTVNFAKDFFPSHIKVSRSFNFDIEDLSLQISEREFYIDPEDGSIKRALFTVRTNYPVDTASLERNLNMEPLINADSGTLRRRSYQFTVSYNDDNTAVYIVSEPLGMPARPVEMQLRINEGVRDSSGFGRTTRRETATVEIPGMNTFAQVYEIVYELVKNEEQVFDQVLVMSTQGALEPDELAKNISAWVLPVDLPQLPGLREQKDYDWRSTHEVVPEVLRLSESLNLEALPNELKFSSINSWKFEAEAGRYIYIKLNKGTRFFGGYVLDEAYEGIIRVNDFPRELQILSDGSILSFSGDKRLSIMSRGIRDVVFDVGRIRPDDLNHLVSQSWGDVKNINFSNYNFNEYNITEQFSSAGLAPVTGDRDIGYFSFDFSRYLDNIPDRNLRHGFFIFTVRSRDGAFSDRRLVMVTDLGFFVKTGADSSRDIFVQSIATGNPVAGAVVQVLGLNGNTLISTQTDNTGRARIPAFGNEFRNERAPSVFTVRVGEDMSFMAFNAAGRTLDYSFFDVGGVRGAADPRTLNAFIFSDRGLYRPGDEVRLGLVVKSGDWAVNLGGTPLECKVTDPRGAEIYNRRFMLSAEGIEDIRFSTHDFSPTGTYTATVFVIQEFRQGNELRERQIFLGSQTVRVEEFLPDTLNVTVAFDPPPQEGWIAPGNLKARVDVRNLFGTAAAGNEVKAQINLTPAHQYFRQYRDYHFRDPFSTRNSYEEFLGSKNTNADGTAQFDLDIAKFERATFRLSFYTEAFEKGSGRNVSAEASIYVSPLPYLIGYKPDGSLSYINQNDVRQLSFIAIAPNAQRTSVDNITLTLMELRYVSALVREPNGVYKYQSIQKEYPVFSRQVSIPASGLEYRLPTDAPGDYRLIITGSNDMEFNSVNYTVAGTANIQRSLNRAAQLEITLNKNDFRNGEEIELMIKAPYAGSGLITIERDRVYAYSWFTSSGETSMQRITVPADLEGNAYVNVHYLRAQNSPEIFMTPLSYGAVPFSISRENRTNHITLDIPDEAKPAEDFIIKYSTSDRGKIIVFAVDEGILQLASYQTPDPLAFFFRKRALEVRTAQILDMVLPAYSVLQSLAAMGGGGGYDELSRNLNPFKRRQNVPVAYWSGIVDSGPEQRELRYRVPDHFNGTLRVMAVAVSGSAVGSIEDRSLVRSAFIISPNAPMLAAPGDEFEISVTVTNNQRGAGERVRLRAIPSEHLAIIGNNEFNLQIPEGRDHTLSVPVRAHGPLGAAQIRFIASNAGQESELSAYMSVRPAVPYRVSLYTGVVRNRTAEVTIDRNLYEEFHTRDVSLSYLPVGMAKGLSFYLNTFPYGCTEQLVSGVFPFLYPQLFRELEFTRAQADEGINRVIRILQARMKENGAIGIWTSNSHDDPMLTVYAAHFLAEARNAGYFVPASLMDRILHACRDIASISGTSLQTLYTRSYAIYILTLNEIVTTPLIESLKRDMGRNVNAETGLAGLYLAGSYALLQRTADASVLLGKIKRVMDRDDSIRYVDDLMYHAVYLNIISRHFPQRLRDISESLLVDMAGQLERQSYTSLSANLSLMAMDGYIKAAPAAETGRFTVTEVTKDNQRRQLTPAGAALFRTPYSANAARISFENRDNLNLFYQVTAAGFDRELPTAEIKNGIEVFREFLDEAGRPASNIKVGDIVTVRLNFRSLSNREHRDVAIVDLLPAGLEADIDSIRRTERGAWTADYVDIREDRLVVYGTVTNRISTFSYKARAINSGSFTVPALFAEALYDRSVWALRPQAGIRIGK
ncbi:MAG: MG2 domain-containing protein [Treponema sp.]|nr:MG2 domain-containing protein [Treponema sp.]